ncbi:MAG: sensor histidine kinase [Patescibacteria group bacterium]
MRIPIRTKWIFVFALVSVIYIVAFIYANVVAENFFVRRQEERDRSHLASIQTEMSQRIAHYKHELAMLEKMQVMRTFIDNSNEAALTESTAALTEDISTDQSLIIDNSLVLADIFKSFAEANPDYQRIRYIDAVGRERLAVSRASRFERVTVLSIDELADQSDTAYFKRVSELGAGNFSVGRISLLRENDQIVQPIQPVFCVSMPVYVDGLQSGIIVLDVFANTLIEPVMTKGDARVNIIDQDGQYILNPGHKDKEWGSEYGNGNSFSLWTQNDLDFFGLLRTQESFSYRCDNSGSLSACRATYGKYQYSDTDDSVFLILATDTQSDIFFAPFREMQMMAVGSFVLAFILALSLTFYSIFRITRPLKYLEIAVQKLNAGDYDTPVPVVSRDEFGDLAEKMNELIKNIRRQDREQYEFITSASHQLRTPVSSIRFETEVLRDVLNKTRGKTESKELVSVISLDIERLVTIIADMMSYLEISKNYFAATTQTVSLKSMVDLILSSLDETQRAKIKLSVPANLVVSVDEERMKFALQHLIQNAVEYTDDNGRVEIIATHEKGQVVIDIVDNGIGIPRTELVKVFSRFFRAKNSYLKKTVGSGLGLVMAKIIVEGHGGKISFSSQEGQGTAFNITFPLI